MIKARSLEGDVLLLSKNHSMKRGMRQLLPSSVTLDPLSEVVGKVVAITDRSITLDCSTQITIDINAKSLTKRQDVKVGDIIGILALEEGDQRIRVIKNA